MIKNVTKSIIFLLAAIALTGCGGVPQTFYYRIDYDLSENNSPNAPVKVTLGINKFSADILYEGDRIVYRNSPYEVQYYHYRRWIAPPRKIVEEKILAHFESSGAFQRVIKLPCNCDPDYILNGKIKAFEEWDENSAWFGIVTLAFELSDPDSKTVVWKKEFSEKTRSAQKEPVAVVAAISKSLKKVSGQAISDVAQYLETIAGKATSSRQ